MKRSSWIALLFLPVMSMAQEQETAFTFKEFIEQVMRHHPGAVQADLKLAEGESLVMQARGNFDPSLESSFKQKQFNGKDYYGLFNAGLKIPTWYGVSFNAGFDQSRGEYLDPSRTLPQDGMWYAGVELELGKGMIIDKRRAELQKAKLYQWSNEMKRRNLLATLRLEAATAYWDWSKAHGEFVNNQEVMINARIRLEGIKEMVTFGDRPAIDTLEAQIQYTNRKLEYERTQLELEIKRQKIELFLWLDGQIPLEIDGLIPEPIANFQENEIPAVMDLNSAVIGHPYFSYLEAGLASDRVEIRLQQESLKPKFTLKYENLHANNAQQLSYNYSLTNHVVGASFSYAIPLRTARASLKLARIEMQHAQLDLLEVRRKLATEIEVAQKTLSSLKEQIRIAETNQRNYEQLYLAEQELFLLGEGSIFMINTREASLLSARYKLIELQWKYQLAKEKLRFSVMPDEQP